MIGILEFWGQHEIDKSKYYEFWKESNQWFNWRLKFKRNKTAIMYYSMTWSWLVNDHDKL